MSPPQSSMQLATGWTREDWPPDMAKSVFLGRALDAIGRIATEGWEGVEFGVMPVPHLPPPSFPRFQGAALTYAISLLAQAEPAMRAYGAAVLNSPFIGSGQYVRPPPQIASFRLGRSVEGSEAQESPLILAAEAGITHQVVYEYLGTKWQEQQEAEAPFITRAAAVQRIFVEACATGRLATLFRGNADGVLRVCGYTAEAYWDRGSSWWTAPQQVLSPRFRTGKVDRKQPNALRSDVPYDDLCWIYVDGSDLERLLKTIGEPPPPSSPWLPIPEEAPRDWCNRSDVEAESRRRCRDAGVGGSDRALCKAMAVMWEQAGRDAITWGTLEQYRVAARKR